jgi:hypothetical protein
MDAKDVLAALGSRLGLGPLAFDDDGLCQLVFDNDMAVDFDARRAPDRLLDVSAVVGLLPRDADAPLYIGLLEANLQGQGTGGATLAIDPAFDEIVLWQRLDLRGATVESVEDDLGSFLGHLRAWRQRAADGTIGGEPAAEAIEDAPSPLTRV